MFKNLYRKIVGLMVDKPLSSATGTEQTLVDELRKSVRGLTDEAVSNELPSEKEWKQNVVRLKELILSDDPRKFLRWDVLEKTMVIGSEDFIQLELNHLRNNQDWNERWSKAIREVAVGYPKPYYKYADSSATLIHHAYHISQFEKITGSRIDTVDFVFEFGAGYGSMCRLLNNLDFTGRYVMFDLPLFNKLQTYFLKSIGIPLYSNDFQNSEQGTICISKLEELKEIIQNIDPKDNSLFIATWSISEVPLKLRDEIFSLVSEFKHYLMAYQNQFGEVDNVMYFNHIKSSLNKNIQWDQFEIEHLPGNSYLIGFR
jgi:hypothetical protein